MTRIWRTGQAGLIRDDLVTALADEFDASDARLLVAVVGPGGVGKSTFLDALAERLVVRGHDVRRTLGELAQRPAPRDVILLLDNAHALGEAAVSRVHQLIADEEASVVLAGRAWPASEEVTELVHLLAAHHPPVVLGPLSHDQIRRLADLRLTDPLTDAEAATLTRLSAGLPWLADWVLASVTRDGRQTLVDCPASVLERLGHDLHRLDGVDEPVRDLLVALAAGFEIDGPAMAHWTPLAGETARGLAQRAHEVGVLTPDLRLPPILARALEVTTAPRLAAVQAELVAALEASGEPFLEKARLLVAGGLRDPRIARQLDAAGDAALQSDPPAAARLYAEAVAAGADRTRNAARRAQAAWAIGDPDEAARIADDLFAQPDAPDLVRAADVSAAVWAQRGLLGRGADVYRWLGPERAGASAPRAVVALYGVGDVAGAEKMLQVADRAAPTSLFVALSELGAGVGASIVGPVELALPALVRASETMTASGAVVPLPESPAVLAALAALHGGNPGLAETVLSGALRGRQGGAGMDARLRIHAAWAAMLRDHLDDARAAVAGLEAGDLQARDSLLLHALGVGIARRADEPTALAAAWQRARELILSVSVDLYWLLPLGELMITAARLRDDKVLAPQMAEAVTLLGRLGDPPLWAATFHWAGIQAGILAERPDDLRPHAAALVRASPHSAMAAGFSAAGRAWLNALAGRVDADAVEAAARGLADLGLPWDGARLAGHAAARAKERRHMVRLLACARDLHPRSTGDPADEPAPVPAPSAPHTGRPPASPRESLLSLRELQIARLVLEGRTYVEIGNAVYISPRTAEHHMARIRRRLGVTSRSEMLERLRAVIDTDDPSRA